MHVRLSVQRLDPDGEGRSYEQQYQVNLNPADTVLDGLLAVSEEQDPTLAFRRMCRSGICGACGMLVNGKPVLSCQARFADLAGDNAGAEAESVVVSVEPLPGFPVLRDLVVDMDPLFDSLRTSVSWVVPDSSYDGKISPETVAAMSEAARCILCGLCEGAVPSDSPAGGPVTWLKAYRFALDPRDALGKTRLKMLEHLGLAHPQALEMLACTCPKQILIDPEKLVLAAGEEDRLAGAE